MNIIKDDKVVMTNGLEHINLIGETFEVANITDTAVVLRDPETKIAICSVEIDDFDNHFKKPDEIEGWTCWKEILNDDYNTYAWYRSRPAKGKVEVKVRYGLTDTFIRKSAACSQGDVFNLEFGIRLAYNRCMKEAYRRNLIVMKESMEYYEAMLVENKNETNAMIASLYGEKPHN